MALITLHSVDVRTGGSYPTPDDRRPSMIHAVKTVRAVTGGGLKYAKLDVFDKVNAGNPVDIEVANPDIDSALEELRANGFEASLSDATFIAFTISVPIKYGAAVREIIEGLGGMVN